LLSLDTARLELPLDASTAVDFTENYLLVFEEELNKAKDRCSAIERTSLYFRITSPIRTLDNVLATPHIGYVSQSLYKTFYEDIVSNIRKWLDAQHQ
jgi:phosphoglycerate dehydrogenase-like enzyme